jgi:hypothetical protein
MIAMAKLLDTADLPIFRLSCMAGFLPYFSARAVPVWKRGESRELSVACAELPVAIQLALMRISGTTVGCLSELSHKRSIQDRARASGFFRGEIPRRK